MGKKYKLLRRVLRRLHGWIVQYWRILALAGGILLVGFCAFSLFVPQTIHFSYASDKACVVSPKFFPGVFHGHGGDTFGIDRPATLHIGSFPLYANSICAGVRRMPQASTTYTISEDFGFLHKPIHIITGRYASLQNVSMLTAKPLSLARPLTLELTEPDSTFRYAVAANGHMSICHTQSTTISCDLQALGLQYGARYPLRIERLFGKTVSGTLVEKQVQTITATAVTNSSIAANSVVYSTPQQIVLTTSKPIASVSGVRAYYDNADGSTTTIPSTSTFSGSTITVTFPNALPRQVNMGISIQSIVATDSSTLETPYVLPFTMSGGPKVTGSNLTAIDIPFSPTITLDFDQPLLSTQDNSGAVVVKANGTPISATVSVEGQALVVQPSSSFGVCATVTVTVVNTIQSNYGVGGSSSWSFSGRTVCYTTFSIGTSVDGRPITAYKFGNGPSLVLYIAAMEGNEQNSANLLMQWIPNVDANPQKIPSYRTLVIIPEINPDGYAADTRLNADGIDLNRNFPSNNWQTQVTEPLAPDTWTNDGGPYPLSEPESQAIATYTQDNSPRLTLTMHSHGGIVEANDAADSIALGNQYASLAGYGAIPTYEIGNFFDYTTTGAYEDWMNDKLGLPALEVELESPTDSEYARNLPALWAMAQIPE